MPADPVESGHQETAAGDVEMADDTGAGAGTTEADATAAADDGDNGDGDNADAHNNNNDDDDDDDEAPERVSFVSYLASPIVTLLVGRDEEQTVLSAHQALLEKSPYLKIRCFDFINDGSPRQIELPDDDVDAVGCFLEFLYTGEYFPKKLPGQRSLESDPSIPPVDDTGDQLLKHARTYTLAVKLGIEPLKSLAISKVHCVNSTAKGEIVYARHVYANSTPDDTTVRAPVASFWATRSHVLRAEAEDEFQAMVLDYPQFAYDVLGEIPAVRVLDEKLRKERNEKMHPATHSAGRKRARHSSGGGAAS
ncbi:hypothetical protein CDD80_6508 [Ophiocordyceps camponoti-rufipedis]|uniref:BTB domain-containing protein n=1 Tax=Ophiocordyceps camponoti-rufipedis TaxID=2004952 RepID=A0A2C5YQ87_9HYPO|nr:hypothetical protein CDD80_6508 [Ophiocordyceps camponoti-rufipedis]